MFAWPLCLHSRRKQHGSQYKGKKLMMVKEKDFSDFCIPLSKNSGERGRGWTTHLALVMPAGYLAFLCKMVSLIWDILPQVNLDKYVWLLPAFKEESNMIQQRSRTSNSYLLSEESMTTKYSKVVSICLTVQWGCNEALIAGPGQEELRRSFASSSPERSPALSSTILASFAKGWCLIRREKCVWSRGREVNEYLFYKCFPSSSAEYKERSSISFYSSELQIKLTHNLPITGQLVFMGKLQRNHRKFQIVSSIRECIIYLLRKPLTYMKCVQKKWDWKLFTGNISWWLKWNILYQII